MRLPALFVGFCVAGQLFAGTIQPEWSLTKAFSEESGARRRVSLNGYWQFRPCQTNELNRPTDYPGWFLVPGCWRSCGFGNFMHEGTGAVVKTFDGRKVEDYPAAFYRRTIKPLESMKGGELRLYFDLAFVKMKVWINGREVPIGNPLVRRFHVPVDGFLEFGKENELVIRTEAEMSARYGDRAGLRSDVWLECRPKRNFGEPVVTTSLTRRCIDVEFSDGGLEDGAGRLRRRIVDSKSGEEVYRDEVRYSRQSTIPFVTPKLWSPSDPNLYRLELELLDDSGSRLDAKALRFGFREFTISGGDYFLNGKPIEVFCDSSWPTRWSPLWHLEPNYVRKAFRTYKAMNMNALYAHPFVLPESFFDVADEEGFLLIYAVTKPKANIHADPFEEFLPKFEAYAAAQSRTRAYRNHPSNVGILADIWYNYHLGTRNPAYVGRPEADGDPNLKLEQPARRAAAIKKLVTVCSRHFPGAVVFTGADGHAGDLYSTHVYHTWGVPPAELSALFSRYGANRKLPIFIGEMNLQYAGAFSDLRNYAGPSYFAENGARLLGEESYRLETVKNEFFCSGPDNDFLRSTWDTDPADRRQYSFISEIYSRTLAEYLDRTILPWRMDGVSGIGFFEYVMTARYLLSTRTFSNFNEVSGDLTRPGTKTENPWGSHHRPPFETATTAFDLRPNPVASVFRKVTAPLAVGFVGAGKDRYESDHAWFGGEDLTKGLVLVNRTDRPHSFDVRVALQDSSGGVMAERKARLDVGVWTNRLAKFTFHVPEVVSRTDATLVAELVSKKGERLSTSMSVQLFPPVDRMANGRVSLALVGADSAFAQKVAALGFSLDKHARTHVFAPLSMSSPDLREQARRLIESGGNVLVMEQTGESSPELVKVRQRQAFLNAADHPALREFKDADFGYWRTGQTTVQSRGEARAGEQWTDWGSRNMIAAHVFRRPTHGNDLSLLTCGFDLFETPLLERRGDKGTAIFSQLEFGATLGRDPVATRLFVNLVRYLDSRRPARHSIGRIATPRGRAFLDKYGIRGTDVDLANPAFSDFSAIVVAAPNFRELRKWALELADYVHGGGKVVYLQLGEDFSPSWIPFSLELSAPTKLRQTLVPSAAGALWRNGWGASEFLWREEPTVRTFARVPRAAQATDPAVVVRRSVGTGEWVFVSVTPDEMENASQGKVDRLLSAILTSAGVALGTNAFPYADNFRAHQALTDRAWSFAEDPRDRGLAEGWPLGKGDAKWLTGQMTVGGDYVKAGCSWSRFLEKEYRGVAWYRIPFVLTKKESSIDGAQVTLRNLVGADTVWVNGRKVGAYGKSGADRGYRIPKGVLKEGENFLVARIEDDSGKGGLCGAVELHLGGGLPRLWKTPYPEGTRRDYEYPCDMIRMY